MNVFKCFTSVTRIQILNLLSEKSYNIKELAESLQVSTSIMTRHIIMLENAGIIYSYIKPARRGIQKVCTLKEKEIIINNNNINVNEQNHVIYIPVGLYNTAFVSSHCGLYADNYVIGLVDDPRYFNSPDHFKADIIWFENGYIEYNLPTSKFINNNISQLQISIVVEAKTYSNFPKKTKILFLLNDIILCDYSIIANYYLVQKNNNLDINSHIKKSTLILLTLTEKGCFLNEHYTSDITIKDVLKDENRDAIFRISMPEENNNNNILYIYGSKTNSNGQDLMIKFTVT